MNLFHEFKRRNMFRMAIFYFVASWLVLQVGELLFEVMAVPDWALRIVLGILILGFPVVMMISWVYEVTEEGVKKQSEIDRDQSITHHTGRRLDIMTMVLLLGVVGLYLIDRNVHPTFSQGELPAAATPPEEPDPSPRQPDLGEVGVSAETPVSGEPVVAVLPFSHRSTGEEDRFFTDGIHDDLLTLLAKLDAFKVISRTSVMEYRNTAQNLRDVGRELGATAILEGAVQKAGERVRINMQLIDVASDAHLWAETYDRELTAGNVFDLQSEVARAIAAALKTTLSPDESNRLERRPTESLRAFELYLQANAFYDELEASLVGQARGFLEEALELDPQFALAWALLARVHLYRYWMMGFHEANREAAKAALDRAFAIDPDLPEAWLTKGLYHYWGFRDYDQALAALDRALEGIPNDAELLMTRAWILRRSGRMEQAAETMRRGLQLDPRAISYRSEYAFTLTLLGRYVDAERQYRMIHELRGDSDSVDTGDRFEFRLNRDGLSEEILVRDSDYRWGSEAINAYFRWLGEFMLGRLDEARAAAIAWRPEWEIDRTRITLNEELLALVYWAEGDTASAETAAARALERMDALAPDYPDDFRIPLARMAPLALLGEKEALLAAGREVLALEPRDTIQEQYNHYDTARAYALAGLEDESLDVLEEVVGFPYLRTARFVVSDPPFRSIKDHPRVQAWLAEQIARVEADRAAHGESTP